MLIQPITIGIVAGEISGDILGALLMRALRSYLPQVHFVGVSGPNMRAEGIETWYDIEELSVMGIVEVLERLPRILYIRHDLVRRFTALQPNVFIGIDSPDFTITLEHRLKKRGIRTIHYVSPSIWAWRRDRIFKIARATDNVLLLFPFEKSIYDRYGIPCQFIGHALADCMPLNSNKFAARQKLDIPSSVRCLALLPGSRKNELAMLSEDFLRTAIKVHEYFPGLKIITPLVNSTCRIEFERIKMKVAPSLSIRIVNNHAHQVMTAADVALLASGTASLECMLAKCPMIVGYRMKKITFALARRLVKTPWISLPNLLAGYELVQEFLQDTCHPDALASAIIELFNDHEKRKTLLGIFHQLHQEIRCNANNKAALAVLALINR